MYREGKLVPARFPSSISPSTFPTTKLQREGKLVLCNYPSRKRKNAFPTTTLHYE